MDDARIQPTTTAPAPSAVGIPLLTVGCQPGKKPRALGPARAGRCAVGCTPSSMSLAAQHCASRLLHTVLGGRAEIGPLALICFSEFSELVEIIANFKKLYRIHLTSENYEINFVGYILSCSRFYKCYKNISHTRFAC
jgi:hypothetical protein